MVIRPADDKMRVLIIRPGALGDTLMLMPAIAQLKASKVITLVARSPGLHFLRPFVRAGSDYEGPGWHRLYLERPDQPLPIPRVDRAVAFLNDPEGCVERNLKSCLPFAPVHLFSPFPPGGERIHVAFYLSLCLEEAGLPVDASRAMEETVRRALLQTKRPLRKSGFVFHPGSGGHSKNYPPERWVGLVKEIRERFSKDTFTVLLGPAEEHLYPFYRERLTLERVSMVLSPDPEELTGLLQSAALYIGHDSGVTHLSAMLGTPTIALFKKNAVHQWRPLGPSVITIENQDLNPHVLSRILKTAEELTTKAPPVSTDTRVNNKPDL